MPLTWESFIYNVDIIAFCVGEQSYDEVLICDAFNQPEVVIVKKRFIDTGLIMAGLITECGVSKIGANFIHHFFFLLLPFIDGVMGTVADIKFEDFLRK